MCLLSKGELKRGSSLYVSCWAKRALLQASQLLGEPEVLPGYPRSHLVMDILVRTKTKAVNKRVKEDVNFKSWYLFGNKPTNQTFRAWKKKGKKVMFIEEQPLNWVLCLCQYILHWCLKTDNISVLQMRKLRVQRVEIEGLSLNSGSSSFFHLLFSCEIFASHFTWWLKKKKGREAANNT